MKKITLSTIAFLLFSLSIIVFQISCQEEVMAKEVKAENKMLFSVYPEDDYIWQFWIAEIDGTNAKRIPISLPTGLTHGKR